VTTLAVADIRVDGSRHMKNGMLRAAIASLVAIALTTPAHAQKSGGVLRVYHNDNPPSASLHEEVTIATLQPFMAVFNNLVIYDQTAKRNDDDTAGRRLGYRARAARRHSRF
jgi:hypothetical protein